MKKVWKKCFWAVLLCCTMSVGNGMAILAEENINNENQQGTIIEIGSNTSNSDTEEMVEEDGETSDIDLQQIENGSSIMPEEQGEDSVIAYINQSKEVTLSILERDIEKGTFKVCVEILGVEEFESVLVPVWCADDQNDIVWYEAKQNEDGKFYVDVNISRHKYHVGKYKIHTYLKLKNGSMVYKEKTDVEMSSATGMVSVYQEKNTTKVQLKIKNFILPAGEKSVVFAVWSEKNGQDDLRWIAAKKTDEREYQADIRLEDFKSIGKFYIHVYAYNKQGELFGIGNTTYVTDTISKGNISIVDEDETNGKYTVEITGIQNTYLLKEVLVPVWCADDQSDIVWYQAKKSGDSYRTVIDLSKHKYHLGTYKIHVYERDVTGDVVLNGTVCEINAGSDPLEISKADQSMYRLSLKNISVPGGNKGIVFAVWSAEKGQDDIIWYEASPNSAEEYAYNVELKNHKSLGEYNVHVYIRLKNNDLSFLTNSSFSTGQIEGGEVEITDVNVEAGKFTVKITGIQNKFLLKEIQIPIWCASDRNDIVWYNAKKDGTGSYVVDVNIANHKYHVGTYNIHVYEKDITGNMHFMGGTTQNMQMIRGLFQAKASEKSTSYSLSVKKPILPGGIKEVQFAVWSEKYGQDDIQWYQSAKLNDLYACNVNLLNHKSLGKYIVHVYATNWFGDKYNINEGGFDVSFPTIGKIELTSTDKTSGKFNVLISDITNANSIKEILVPIWCKDDQSDIVWYQAVKSDDGTYKANIDISKHKYHTGQYKIHTYIRDIVGDLSFSKAISCDMSVEAGNILATDSDGTEQYFNILLTNHQIPGGLKEIKFAVWSEKGGQDDLKWYVAAKGVGNSYQYSVPIRNHRTLGKHFVHAYALNCNGDMVLVNTTSFEVTKKAVAKTVSSESIDGAKGTFRIRISGIEAASGIERIQVPIWVAEDQTDIVWYNAKSQGNGDYTVDVKVSNHKNHFGNYKIHVYVTMNNGITNVAGTGSCYIEALNYVWSQSLGNGRYKVAIVNPNGGNVYAVKFPTWSETNGQDDIVWYMGINEGNGTWSVTVDGRNHRNYGNYITHVYGTVEGADKGLGNISYYMKPIYFADRIGAFSTVSNNNANGTYNMQRALSSFNGVVIQPGQTVSFFGVAGPCGAAQGYLPAGVVGGIGYGGGICQASTTLYGAVIRAGLTVVERRNHSVPSKYVPIGLDAMVDYGSSDFKFRNDFSFPVKLVTYSSGQTLYAEIYGNQPAEYDYIEPNSWWTSSRSAAANRTYYKNGKAVRVEALPSSWY